MPDELREAVEEGGEGEVINMAPCLEEVCQSVQCVCVLFLISKYW